MAHFNKVVIWGGGWAGMMMASRLHYVMPEMKVIIMDNGKRKGPQWPVFIQGPIGPSYLASVRLQEIQAHRCVHLYDDEGRELPANVQANNLYSLKAIGEVHQQLTLQRSGPEPAWIFPEADEATWLEVFKAKLLAWDRNLNWFERDAVPIGMLKDGEGKFLFDPANTAIISTIPMWAAFSLCGEATMAQEILEQSQGIQKDVLLAEIEGLGPDVLQMHYYPKATSWPVRAILFRNRLCVEGSIQGRADKWDAGKVIHFVRETACLTGLKDKSHTWGTLVRRLPVSVELRKGWMRYLTQKHGVYSLGVHATLANKCIHELVSDIDQIITWLTYELRVK